MKEKMDTSKVFGLKAESGRWLFVLFGLVIHMCLGAVYAWGAFKADVMQHYTLNFTEGGLPFIVFIFFFALLMPFGGRFIQKYGPRRVGIVGGIMVGVGWFLASLSTNLVMLCLTYGVIAGAGVGIAYGAPIQVSTRWFPDRKGLAVGMTVGGFGLSAAAISPIGRALIDSADVPSMFRIFGIAFLILTFLLFLTMKFPKPNWKPAGWAGPKAGSVPARDYTPMQMLKTPAFWALFFCFLFGSTAGLMAIGIAGEVGREIFKISAALAATLTGVFAFFNFIGRPLFGWLTDRISPKNSALVAFLLIVLGSLGILLLSGVGANAVYIVSFAMLWMALGGWLAIAPTVTATFFGATHNATNYGLVFFAYGLGAVIGNLVSGQAMDLFGNYDIAFILTASLAAIGIVVAATMLKPSKQ